MAFNEWMIRHDFEERLLDELNDILGEELNEEIHRSKLSGVKFV